MRGDAERERQAILAWHQHSTARGRGVDENKEIEMGRPSSLVVTVDDDEAGAGAYWTLGCTSQNAFEVDEDFDGVYAVRCSTDYTIGDKPVAWQDVPEPLRDYAIKIFRAAGFEEEDIQRERPLPEGGP
jgi:hypothetical protein